MSAKLPPSHPDSWYVTFGLGTPNGSTYSEIVANGAANEEDVRYAVIARYGTEWAFIYAPYEAERAKLRATLRERIDLDGKVLAPSDSDVKEALSDPVSFEITVTGRNGHKATMRYEVPEGWTAEATLSQSNEIVDNSQPGVAIDRHIGSRSYRFEIDMKRGSL